MNIKNKVLMIASLAIASVSSVTAADLEAGKAKAVTCIACHGVGGASTNDLWPNLKGQKKGYLIKQIKSFKDGTRKDPLMSSMATALTDEDIENLAAYYSSLK